MATAVYARGRVNRGALCGGASTRPAQVADLRAFASQLDEKIRLRREEREAELGASTAVDAFSAVFNDASSSSSSSSSSSRAPSSAANGVGARLADSASASSCGASAADMSKQVDRLVLQLHHARDVIAAAKKSDAELMSVNAQLDARVRELSAENQKLFSLAKYLRHFEKENAELRFIVQGLFKDPSAAAPHNMAR